MCQFVFLVLGIYQFIHSSPQPCFRLHLADTELTEKEVKLAHDHVTVTVRPASESSLEKYFAQCLA